MKIVGAVSSTPGRAHVLAERLARLMLRDSPLVAEPLFSASRLVLWSIRRPNENANDFVATSSADGQDRFWLVGEGVTALESNDTVVADIDATIASVLARAEGDFLGVRADPLQRVTLYLDTWGLTWIHLRRLPDATVFGSDVAALCEVDGTPPGVDRESLLLELSIGYCPDDRTLFEGIFVPSPGSVVTLDGSSMDVRPGEGHRYGNEWFNASDGDKFRALDALYRRMGERTAKLANGRVAISLSAGYDSRYALAVLGGMGAVGRLFTFGDPASDEVVDAHAVARRHSEETVWENFTIPETRWSEWTRMIQSLGNAGIVQWCGWAGRWLEFVGERASACAIGYLGDALSGKRLDAVQQCDTLARELDPAIDNWTRHWVAWELDVGEWARSPLLRPAARIELLRAATTRFASLLGPASFASDHQRALHLNLVGRQRRWVGTQPRLMSEHARPLTFFTDRAYRKFWMNVDIGDLLGQALYLRYARTRFPHLFPTPQGPISSLASRVARRVRRSAGAVLGRTAEPRRPPPIQHAVLLRPHYSAILDALDTSSAALDDVIDVAATRDAVIARSSGRNDPRLTSDMLFRCVNVTHLLALARARPVSPGTPPVR